MRLSLAAWLSSAEGRDASRKVSMSWMITTDVFEVGLARRALLRAVQQWRMSID